MEPLSILIATLLTSNAVPAEDGPDFAYDIITNGQKKGVSVDVYYESLCPDSRSFFINELLPTVHKLGSHMFVNLIPYGRAETFVDGGAIEFKCQHGAPECLGNKVHACVIEKTLTDNALAVNVTSCLFEEYFQPTNNGEKCCRKFKVSWDDVKTCAYGSEGSQLLKKYGDMTNRLLPIDFIPTIAINNNRGSRSYQAAILKNLTHEVCKILKKNAIAPAVCGE
uniref:Gamma-interferon-inducible lysosomal thiol reductase n=1 Tax=Lygus hesperus TaxID=30085 RepID=A0A0A9XF02_LYGHE